MKLASFVLLLYLSIVVAVRRSRKVPLQEQDDLESAHRNSICCSKNMRCCVKPRAPPIEVRAVMARCPSIGSDTPTSLTRNIKKPLYSVNVHSLKGFQGFDEDEPLVQSRVTDCNRKVLMTIKLHHSGPVNTRNQYIVIDHLYDPMTEKIVRLLNPYVVRFRQEPVAKAFYLKFIDYVNSEAREQVYNKHDGNYTGCYTTRTRSTCGIVRYDGKIIPYSEGFCCSCDSKENAERQPDSVNEKNEAIISYSDPAYLLDHVECPRNYYKDQLEINAEAKALSSKKLRKVHNDTSPVVGTSMRSLMNFSTSKRWVYQTFTSKSMMTEKPATTTQGNYHKYLKPEPLVFKSKRNDDKAKKTSNKRSVVEDFKSGEGLFPKGLLRRIRQTFPSGVQKRGGQNCADRYTPPGLDPKHYHESSHCLRFSEVWYGMYKLGDPYVEQTIWINIYERFETGTSERWREITNQTVRLSRRTPRWEDEIPTISILQTTKTLADDSPAYDRLKEKRILIPEGVHKCDVYKYPEMRNGAEEFLVVKPSQIAVEGDQCDKIGVGFEAFYKQPRRCSVPRGTCLHFQPKHLWRHDKAAQKKDKKGCYYLKYHANITDDPLIVNETTGEKYLSVKFEGAHISTIDVEIKADFNAMIRKTTNAVITEVYVDSTCDKVTSIIIKVTNTGLISGQYMVQLSDFPLELPDYFNRIKSRITMIPPQNQHIFNLEIRYRLPTDLIFCSVEVLNAARELIALRRVRIQRNDRCICTWHCLCACLASSAGLKCNPMSLEHYNAAGFGGSLPIITYMVHLTLLDDLLSVAFYFALFLLAVLLVLGIAKAVLGLCCYGVGMFGLPVLLDLPKPMKHYYEASLRKETVVYDNDGWPVHPKTKARVRNISRATEFCTNVVFFFTYPLACTILIVKRLCCPYYSKGEKRPKGKRTAGSPPRQKKTYKSPKKGQCNNEKCAKKSDPKTQRVQRLEMVMDNPLEALAQEGRRKRKATAPAVARKTRQGSDSSKTSASGHGATTAYILDTAATPFQESTLRENKQDKVNRGDSVPQKGKSSKDKMCVCENPKPVKHRPSKDGDHVKPKTEEEEKIVPEAPGSLKATTKTTISTTTTTTTSETTDADATTSTSKTTESAKKSPEKTRERSESPESSHKTTAGYVFSDDSLFEEFNVDDTFSRTLSVRPKSM